MYKNLSIYMLCNNKIIDISAEERNKDVCCGMIFFFIAIAGNPVGNKYLLVT